MLRANKIVFNISFYLMLICIVGILVITPYKDVNICLEIILNILISLVGGALLSAVLAVINFKTIKFQYERDFITSSFECIMLIRQIANWFIHQDPKVNYEVDYSKIEKDDLTKGLKLKIQNRAKNAPYIKDLYQRIARVSEFDFNKFYLIIDDYTESLMGLSKFCKHNITLMDSMLKSLKQYDYKEHPQMNASLQLYIEKAYDEYAIYNEVGKHFKSLVVEDKLDLLSGLYTELLMSTKVNNKLKKIYGKN